MHQRTTPMAFRWRKLQKGGGVLWVLSTTHFSQLALEPQRTYGVGAYALKPTNIRPHLK